jgi:hypothetical protein
MFGALMLATVETTQGAMGCPAAFAIVGGAFALAWYLRSLS